MTCARRARRASSPFRSLPEGRIPVQDREQLVAVPGADALGSELGPEAVDDHRLPAVQRPLVLPQGPRDVGDGITVFDVEAQERAIVTRQSAQGTTEGLEDPVRQLLALGALEP